MYQICTKPSYIHYLITTLIFFMDFLAGAAGFEPTNNRVKVCCLTAWRYPYNYTISLCTRRANVNDRRYAHTYHFEFT